MKILPTVYRRYWWCTSFSCRQSWPDICGHPGQDEIWCPRQANNFAPLKTNQSSLWKRLWTCRKTDY